jgi:hypothetical protein
MGRTFFSFALLSVAIGEIPAIEAMRMRRHSINETTDTVREWSA